MTARVVVTREAGQQIRAFAGWWREHRPAVPRLFRQELRQAFCSPGIGRISEATKLRGV